MVKIGNFLFRYRNGLFPVFYALLFIPSPTLFENPWAAIGTGLAVALLGQGIRVATIGLEYIIRGGKDKKVYAEKLVTEGLFSHCRNPLYVGNILELLGLGVVANSLIFVVAIVPLFIFFYQAIVRAEENFLLQKFGNDFQMYMQRVNRWLPSLSGLGQTLSSMHFNWRRVLLKEYNSTFIWMGAAVLASAKTLYWSSQYQPEPNTRFILIGIFILLALTYGIVRYLKKSKRLVAY